MAYLLEEQETIIRFDKLDKIWYFETNVYEHINKILKDIECYDVIDTEEEKGRVIYIRAKIKNLEEFNIKPWAKKRKKMSEEQKRKVTENLKRVSR